MHLFPITVTKSRAKQKDRMSAVYSRAFLYGESVFTTLRIEEGLPYFLEEHRDRLMRSSEHLWPGSNPHVSKLLSDVLSRIPKKSGIWRLSLHQEGERGSWRPNPQNIILLSESWIEGLNPSTPQKLKTVEIETRAKSWPSFLKSADYFSRIQAAKVLPIEFEPLFYTKEGIAELMFANIVFWNGDEFVTPLSGPNVLDGIGKNRFHKMIKKMGFKSSEQNILTNQLSQFQCAYAVNTIRGLIKIESIDDYQLQAHPKERELEREFFKRE